MLFLCKRGFITGFIVMDLSRFIDRNYLYCCSISADSVFFGIGADRFGDIISRVLSCEFVYLLRLVSIVFIKIYTVIYAA